MQELSYKTMKTLTIKDLIGKDVATNYKDLKEIRILNGITRIPVDSFKFHAAVSIVTLPDTIKYIYSGCFSYCRELETVNLPDSLLYIGSFAFAGCNKLSSIIIPHNVNYIGGGAFCYCRSLISVIILGSVLPLFQNCSKLSSIMIGENLQDFDLNSFCECKNIKSIVVDTNNPIYDSRNDCNAIIESKSDTLLLACNSTIIPNGIKHISWRAFRECGRIRTLLLPESLETIDGLPDNVKKIIVPKGRKMEFKKKLPWTRGIELVEQ